MTVLEFKRRTPEPPTDDDGYDALAEELEGRLACVLAHAGDADFHTNEFGVYGRALLSVLRRSVALLAGVLEGDHAA
jgi:hypothetical protein